MDKQKCNGCGDPKYIVNKKYGFCDECNFKRLHKGQSKFEYNKTKKKSIENKPKKRKAKVLTKTQEFRFELKEEYKKVCDKIDNERDHLCTGCGTHEALSHSHIISRKDCAAINRLDLIVDEKNITFHCIDRGHLKGCHQKWESKNEEIMKTLLDYEDNMNYVKSIDEKLYNRLKNK